MAKWKFAHSRKLPLPSDSHMEPATAVSAKRTSISKGYRGPTRYRPSVKIESPQGWRATFLGF